MPLNTLPMVASSRRPRAIVQVGPFGRLATLPRTVSWSVGNNSYYEADTFRIMLATSALPIGNDAAWFSEQTEIFAQISAGFPEDPNNPQPGELTQLIFGRVDDIGLKTRSGVLTLTGRDLTAAFIDARISAGFQNQTSSQIAIMLAQSHGLDTSNITTTTTKVEIGRASCRERV